MFIICKLRNWSWQKDKQSRQKCMLYTFLRPRPPTPPLTGVKENNKKAVTYCSSVHFGCSMDTLNVFVNLLGLEILRDFPPGPPNPLRSKAVGIFRQGSSGGLPPLRTRPLQRLFGILVFVWILIRCLCSSVRRSKINGTISRRI